MKKILFAFFLLFAAGASAQPWIQLNSGTVTNLRDVHFINADTGFVAGEDSIVLRTLDGGATWTRLANIVSPSPGNLNAIWMADIANGFAAPEFPSFLPRTNNGGNSWFAASSQANNPCFPDGLHFENLAEGYMYGTGCFGGCYVTRWNVNQWQPEQMLYYGTSPNGTIGLKGLTKDPVSGVYVAVGDWGTIFRSTDGFTTWDTIAYADTTNFTAVDYAGNNTFYASSSQILNSVFISTDGGQTFAYDNTFAPTFFYSGFYDIDMLTNGFGVTGGYSWTTGLGFLQWRNTSGSWFNYQDVNHIIRAVYVVDSTLAYAVGDSGAIYKYSTPTGIGMIHESAVRELQVSPSPVAAGEKVMLGLSPYERWNIEVFDARGRRTLRTTVAAGYPSIAVDDFASSPGLYFIRAKGVSSRSVFTGRVVVE